jgi:hypothetical protein
MKKLIEIGQLTTNGVDRMFYFIAFAIGMLMGFLIKIDISVNVNNNVNTNTNDNVKEEIEYNKSLASGERYRSYYDSTNGDNQW